MRRVLLSLSFLALTTSCTAQDDDNTEPRLLSNQNTAAVTGAALGLGIGIAGSILVGKLIEDASKCKPQGVHPPAFGRFLPDLLHLAPSKCRQGSNYRQTQASYPSPGYVIPSPSTQYIVPSPNTQYIVPSPSTTSTQYQTVPNLSTPAVSGGYSVPNLHKPSLSSGYQPTHTYAPTPSSQPLFSQTSPHKASVDPPKDIIELVNTDYTDYNEYSYTPNAAIQPRHLSEEDLFKPVPTQQIRQPKAFHPSSKLHLSLDTALPNSIKAFTPIVEGNQENKFSQTALHKAEPNPVKFESQQREAKAQGSFFQQTEAHKPEPDAPRSVAIQESSKSEVREEKSIFTQTEAHTAEPDAPSSSSRHAKTISNFAKLSATREEQLTFQPVPTKTTKPPFLEAFQPISSSAFAPVPAHRDHFEASSSPSIVIARARTPKLFGRGIERS